VEVLPSSDSVAAVKMEEVEEATESIGWVQTRNQYCGPSRVGCVHGGDGRPGLMSQPNVSQKCVGIRSWAYGMHALVVVSCVVVAPTAVLTGWAEWRGG